MPGQSSNSYVFGKIDKIGKIVNGKPITYVPLKFARAKFK